MRYHTNSNPLIITTAKVEHHTAYSSNWYTQLTDSERDEYETLLEKLSKAFEKPINATLKTFTIWKEPMEIAQGIYSKM